MKKNKDEFIDFARVAETVTNKGNLKGPDDLSIWGGTLHPDQLHPFYMAWKKLFENKIQCFYETVDEICFCDGSVLPETVLRIAVFSEEGSLQVRHDGVEYHWFFIGDRARFAGPPDFNQTISDMITCKNFWDNPDTPTAFRESERTVLLWGQLLDNGDYWEDRYADANRLNYPQKSGKHACLQLKVYTFSGRIHFVRYMSFGKEAKNAKRKD